ncbi:MAG: D-alanyl-D-alanine carboxypeptidase, partial [Pseudanabaena sp. ELA607]
MWNWLGALTVAAATQWSTAREVNTTSQMLVNLAFSTINRPVLAQLDRARQEPNPVAARAIDDMMTDIRQAGYSGQGQGVWIQSHDGTVVAEHLSDEALPAASLTKMITSLVALERWGPKHRFVTTVSMTGKRSGDTLIGNLIIQGGGDPFFVSEDGIIVGNTLNRLGIRKVQGDLIVIGRFYMNFEEDTTPSANSFLTVLDSESWPGEVDDSFQGMPGGTRRPVVKVSGQVRRVAKAADLPKLVGTQKPQQLLRYRSLPLAKILYQMNTFSNNPMADTLAKEMGGGPIVAARAAKIVKLPAAEIQLINGSGLGQKNQISPRAVVATIMAMQNRAAIDGFSLVDLMPMSDCYCGTIQSRNLPSGALLKTGTLSDVSALAGTIPSQKYGRVWFAVINRGNGDIGVFHRVQENVLRTLTVQWGEAPPRQFNFGRLGWQEANRAEVIRVANKSAKPTKTQPPIKKAG